MSSDEEDSVNEYDSDEGEEVASDSDGEEVAEKPKKKRKGKKNKDPNKPKRNMSAFFLYSNAHRERIKNENPDVKFGEVAKILSVEFKGLSGSEKAKWDKLAAKDKERYQREMANYVPEDSDSDSGGGRKKKKKKKDPNKPKRNQSAYFLYSNAVRNQVKADYPDAAFGDIARIISSQFKNLSAKERAKYDTLAAKDKERYQSEMSSYRG